MYNPLLESHRMRLAELIQDIARDNGYRVQSFFGVREDVFVKEVGDRITVRIYSSVVKGEVREKDKDAIRVALVYTTEDGTERGLARETRVNRVGSLDEISSRLKNRVRLCEKKVCEVGLCERCGAPKFLSKKGRWVCAEICWGKGESPEPRRPHLCPPQTCEHCGARKFKSKKGNWVCSMFCWEKKSAKKEPGVEAGPVRFVVVEEHYFRTFKVQAGSESEAIAAVRDGRGVEQSFEKVFKTDEEEWVVQDEVGVDDV